jgi:hypothetical protein
MEGRRKEIILLVLAVVALVVALFTFRGKPSPPPAAPGPEPTETAKVTEPERATGAQAPRAGEGISGGEESEATAGQREARNPFSAPGVEPEAGPEVAPPTEVPEGPPEGTAGGEGPKTALTLTGIVAGTPTVAILRQNDQRYFVEVGEYVGEGYRVAAIGRQEVVLAGPEGKITLRMGGRQ